VINEGGQPDIEDLVENLWAEIADEVKEEALTGKTLTTTVTPNRIALVHSQKAKSLLKYISEFKSGRGEWRAPATELVLLEDDFDVVDAAFTRITQTTEAFCPDGFLRTCPEFARHGVLESIRVSRDNLREHWKHLKETMEREDENGCLMLQPFTEATSSCVLAPQQYAAVGIDHDGITAGHGLNLYFHLDESDTQLSDHMASIGHQRGEYELEFVSRVIGQNNIDRHPSMEMYLTQVRGAPPHPPRAPPFTYDDGIVADTDVAIPGGRVTVKEVRHMTGLEDVIFLEREITKETMPEGFVVSEPNGSLLSHICAHCRAHGIPYIVGEVEVGQTWVEGSPTWGAVEGSTKIVPAPYNPCAPSLMSEFNRGLEMSRTHWQRQQGWLAHFFHQWVGMNYNGSKSALLAGGFVGWMCKAILGLSLGEMRHSRRVKKNTSVEMFPVMTAMIGTNKWVDITETSEHATTVRKHYYAAMEKIDVTFEEMRDALAWCVGEFNTGWGSGYGGTAWGECARRGMLLCDAVIEFQADPNSDTLNALTGAVNSAKNAEHNNGFLYGKFLSKDAFNYSDVHVDESGAKKGLFPHSNKGLECMFRTFELARSFIEGTARNVDCSTPSVPWSSLFGFLKNTNANYWRENLICISEEVPEYLREAANTCGPALLHHGNKYSHKENFIPCGHYECETCRSHVEVIEQMRYTAEIGALMLTDAYPEAYLATKQKSAPVSYSVCKMLKSREYEDVKPRMWVEAWQGLKMKDPMYPMLSGLLTKFVKNQMGDDKEWTDAVVAISKEEEE